MQLSTLHVHEIGDPARSLPYQQMTYFQPFCLRTNQHD